MISEIDLYYYVVFVLFFQATGLSSSWCQCLGGLEEENCRAANAKVDEVFCF